VTRKPAPNLQYAALPYRRRADGTIEVMLVTSRDTGRIGDQPIGFYHYDKRLADGSARSCTVATFAFEVEEQSKSWTEQEQRHTRWFASQDAADAVQEPELSPIILNFAATLA
jgi:hypothetical protein